VGHSQRALPPKAPIYLSAHVRPGEHTVAYFIPLVFANGSPAWLWTTVSIDAATPGSDAAASAACAVVRDLEQRANPARTPVSLDGKPPP
jgi:hypothetical protein